MRKVSRTAYFEERAEPLCMTVLLSQAFLLKEKAWTVCCERKKKKFCFMFMPHLKLFSIMFCHYLRNLLYDMKNFYSFPFHYISMALLKN